MLSCQLVGLLLVLPSASITLHVLHSPILLFLGCLPTHTPYCYLLIHIPNGTILLCHTAYGGRHCNTATCTAGTYHHTAHHSVLLHNVSQACMMVCGGCADAGQCGGASAPLSVRARRGCDCDEGIQVCQGQDCSSCHPGLPCPRQLNPCCLPGPGHPPFYTLSLPLHRALAPTLCCNSAHPLLCPLPPRPCVSRQGSVCFSRFCRSPSNLRYVGVTCWCCTLGCSFTVYRDCMLSFRHFLVGPCHC